MKRLTLSLILLLLASPAWAMSTVYRHLEPETVVYQTLPSAVQTQFTTNENIKVIKYGSSITLSSITANLSQVNGIAFVSNPSVDLRPYIGFKGTWSDVGTAGVGFFGTAGTGEQYTVVLGGATLDGNMEAVGTAAYTYTGTLSKDTGIHHTGLQSLKNIRTGGGQWGDSTAFAPVQLALYKYDSWVYLDAAYTSSYNGIWDYLGANIVLTTFASPLATWIQQTGYCISGAWTSTATYHWANASGSVGATSYVDDLVFEQVLTPSALGTTITSSVGGAQNWTTKGSTPAAATFNVLVTKN